MTNIWQEYDKKLVAKSAQLATMIAPQKGRGRSTGVSQLVFEYLIALL